MTELENDIRIIFFLDHPREMGFVAYYDGNFVSGNNESNCLNKKKGEKVYL